VRVRLEAREVELARGELGYHHAVVEGVSVGDRYAYLLDDGTLELPDPASASQPDGVHGRSQVVDHGAFAWSDRDWRGIPLVDYVIYELHVGAFTPDGTFDAIHGIVDTTPNPFLAELTAAVDEIAAQAGREVVLIAESDLNDVRVITPREQGGLGFDAQWTDDFHHALHVALTGETRGYYADFQGGLADLATCMARAFRYTGQRSEHRGRRFGTATAGIPPERFVVYAQNHDQVGNRLLGDRLSTLLDPARQRVALAAVLLSPFTPMLFMGEEYGEQRPFPYFVSHGDGTLVEAVRAGRRDEFAHFGFEGAAPDPAAEATFASAILDWESRTGGEHADLLAFTRELLRLRREHPSVRSMPEPSGVTVSEGVLSIERNRDGERSRLVLDCRNASVTFELLAPRSQALLRTAQGELVN
jgi:maltooligosyltrehalose trehalohydrolase